MKVIAWSQNLTPEKCKEAGVDYVSKEDLFRQSDFISIHVVLSQRSRGMVGAPEFALMKPTAYLINTSRGPIVDEAAMLAALRDKKIGGAGLDVFDVEPLPKDHPLRKMDNVVHHAASRLRVAEELPELFRRRGRGHPRLHRRQAGAGDDELTTPDRKDSRDTWKGRMRLLLLSLLVALIAVQAPRSASAQPQGTVPLTYLEAEPEQLVEAAFSTPFGKLLIAEFAAAVADSADAACLKAKGLETSALEGRARVITIRHGVQLVGKYLSTVDRTAFTANLASRMGAGAEAELARLRDNPDVRAYLELAMPIRHAATALAVAETLGRNLLILKIKLSRRFDPALRPPEAHRRRSEQSGFR